MKTRATLLLGATLATAPANARADGWQDVLDVSIRSQRDPSEEVRRWVEFVEEGAPIPPSLIRIVQRAYERSPASPDIAFLYGSLLGESVAMLTSPQSTARHAMTVFNDLRNTRPDYEPERVASELAVLQTRLHNFEEAAVEYQRADSLFVSEQGRSVRLGNLAEVTMEAGHLAEAGEIYRQAIQTAERLQERSALLYWGLAVTLHRLGERQSSIAMATLALQNAPSGKFELRGPGVFYEPSYEIHYYDALTDLALALAPDVTEADRTRFNQSACTAWSQFLLNGGDQSLFAEQARREVIECAKGDSGQDDRPRERKTRRRRS